MSACVAVVRSEIYAALRPLTRLSDVMIVFSGTDKGRFSIVNSAYESTDKFAGERDRTHVMQIFRETSAAELPLNNRHGRLLGCIKN